jgi:hypothetical protein
MNPLNTDKNPHPHTGQGMDPDPGKELNSGTGNRKNLDKPLRTPGTPLRPSIEGITRDLMDPQTGETAPLNLTLVPMEEEIQDRETTGRETGQKGEEKEATHTTTGEKGQEKILTRGINPRGIPERIRDSRKGPPITKINNLLEEPSATQEPRTLQPRPSSAKSTTKITDITDTISLTTLDMTQVTPTMITTTTTTGTEGPRESATMTTEKKTP